MQKGIRKKILNVYLAAFRAKPFFKEVYGHFPGFQVPSADMTPAVYICRSVERIAWKTNREAETDFPLALFGFCFEDQDIELKKADVQDEMESVVASLVESADYSALADIPEVQTADPGPLSLAQYGIELEIQPPLGVVRLDVLNTFIYNRLD